MLPEKLDGHNLGIGRYTTYDRQIELINTESFLYKYPTNVLKYAQILTFSLQMFPTELLFILRTTNHLKSCAH